MKAAKPIVLCADDYAIAPGVSHAIRELILLGRISAVSCLTQSPLWPEESRRLKAVAKNTAVGLHFSLTGPKRPFRQIVREVLTRKLNRHYVIEALETQLDAFETYWSGPPDFIDGHQYVHQLPTVRSALIEVYKKRFSGTFQKKPYIRTVRSPFTQWKTPKIAATSCLGFAFSKRLKKDGIPHNESFGGIYDFNSSSDFGRELAGWLKSLPARSLIVCHPGLVDAKLLEEDPLTTPRETEYQYLKSDDFLENLKANQVYLDSTMGESRATPEKGQQKV